MIAFGQQMMKGGLDLSGLIAYFRFNDNLYDEINDEYATGNNETFTDAINNKALKLLADGDYAFLNERYSFTDGTNDTPFSFGFVVNFDEIEDTFLISKRKNTDSGEYTFVYYNGDFKFSIISENDIDNKLSKSFSFSPQTGVDYRIFITYDSSHTWQGIKLYINEVEMSGVDASVGTYIGMRHSTDKVYISTTQITNSWRLKGYLDSLSIWNKELSLKEVQNLGAKLQTSELI